MSQPTLALAAFETLSDDLRRQFKNELSTLPEPCATIAIRAYEERIERARERRLLGEYAPWLIADLTGQDHASFRDGAIAWLYIYLFVLMLDDHIDRPDDRRHEELIVGSLLLQRGLTMAQAGFPIERAPELAALLRSAFDDTAAAGVREIVDHRGVASPYSQDDIASTGKKLAMLRFCALAVTATSDSLHGLENVGVFIDFFAVGIQLLDDLADYDEDYEVGNWTFPLSAIVESGYATIAPNTPRVVGKRELLALMVVSGALERTLDEATTSLCAAMHAVASFAPPDSRTMSFTQSLIDAAADLRALAVTVRERAQRTISADTPWHEQIDQATLDEVERAVRVVGQSS